MSWGFVLVDKSVTVFAAFEGCERLIFWPAFIKAAKAMPL
jgi:hypothetical protein